jgi:hypothetical protein
VTLLCVQLLGEGFLEVSGLCANSFCLYSLLDAIIGSSLYELHSFSR